MQGFDNEHTLFIVKTANVKVNLIGKISTYLCSKLVLSFRIERGKEPDRKLPPPA